jgi:hypothetical protein
METAPHPYPLEGIVNVAASLLIPVLYGEKVRQEMKGDST